MMIQQLLKYKFTSYPVN